MPKTKWDFSVHILHTNVWLSNMLFDVFHKYKIPTVSLIKDKSADRNVISDCIFHIYKRYFRTKVSQGIICLIVSMEKSFNKMTNNHSFVRRS